MGAFFTVEIFDGFTLVFISFQPFSGGAFDCIVHLCTFRIYVPCAFKYNLYLWAVVEFLSSALYQNSLASEPGNGALSFYDWCLKIDCLFIMTSAGNNGTAKVTFSISHSYQAPLYNNILGL